MKLHYIHTYMNFISAGCRLNKEIKNAIAQTEMIYRNIDQEIPPEVSDRIKQSRLYELREGMRTGLEIWKMFVDMKKEISGDRHPIKGTYFITVRPDPKLNISFEAFKERCIHFVSRSIIAHYRLSFEQKGTNEESLGDGFHAHMIVNTVDYVRSKGELLRYAQTSFRSMCEPQSVQVDRLAKQTDLDNVNNYLTTYVSKDDHKEPTMEWDTLWRARLGIERFYESLDCPYQVHGGQS